MSLMESLLVFRCQCERGRLKESEWEKPSGLELVNGLV